MRWPLSRRGSEAFGRHTHLVEVGVQWPPETFLGRKLEGLARRGIRVTVASPQVLDPAFRLSGVELLPLPAPGSRAPAAWRAAAALVMTSPARLVTLVNNVLRVPPALSKRHGGRLGLLAMCLPLARLRPDVIQFEWNVAAVDHLPLFDVWTCPVLTSCRGSDITVYPYVPGLRAYADRLPEVMRRATAVHCVSERIVTEATGFGLDPHKAHVIRPAVDMRSFTPAFGDHSTAAPYTIVMVGQLRWEKGHEYALEAIRRLVDAGVPARLDILGGTGPEPLGPSPEEHRIRHTVADLDLERYVHLPGQLTPREVARRMAQADVLLHASLAEGIANVVIEAMACGLPVVTTSSGAVQEVMTDGVEGSIVDPRAPDPLADALWRLWRDPGLRRRMGAAGQRRALDLALEPQIQQFLEMYHEAVA